MNKSSIRALPAALALVLASIGLSAAAQTQSGTAAPAEPSTMDKAKEMGGNAVDATKRTTKKAVAATERGAKKAAAGTKHVAKKTGNAVESAGHATADGMRSAGHAIGEKVPGTAENEAAKKP